MTLNSHDIMTIVQLITREIDILVSAKMSTQEKYASYVLHLVDLANRLKVENN